MDWNQQLTSRQQICRNIISLVSLLSKRQDQVNLLINKPTDVHPRLHPSPEMRELNLRYNVLLWSVSRFPWINSEVKCDWIPNAGRLEAHPLHHHVVPPRPRWLKGPRSTADCCTWDVPTTTACSPSGTVAQQQVEKFKEVISPQFWVNNDTYCHQENDGCEIIMIIF